MIANNGPEYLAEIDHIDDRDPDGYYISSKAAGKYGLVWGDQDSIGLYIIHVNESKVSDYKVSVHAGEEHE